ncbi:MAG: hypothetical protein IKV23_03830 [Bacteroidaceae bacterium]|nr:hypothetical protein [Bacteroidaceae bacterium]
METTVTKELLRKYAQGECSAGEVAGVQEHLSKNPQRIIELLGYMREDAMAALGINESFDPFKPLVAATLNSLDAHTANVRLHSVVSDMFSGEKKYSENVPNCGTDHIVGENNIKKPTIMKSINFSSEEFVKVNESALRMMENISHDKSTLGNMVAQLLIQVPSLSVDEATDTCRKLVAGVTRFGEVYDELREQSATEEMTTEIVYDRCVASIADKIPNEQAAALINFISFVKFVDASNLGRTICGDASNSFEHLLSEQNCIDGDITPEILDELKAKLKDAIENSTIAITNEESLRAIVGAATDSASLTEQLAEKHLSDFDFKCYAALVAYIACVKGEIEGCDKNVQPEILGASVAAGVEREKVMEGVKSGEISQSKAVLYLKWIGGALLYGLFAWVAYHLVLTLFSLTALVTIAMLGDSFAAVSAGMLLGGFTAFKGVKWFFDSVATPIVEGAGEILDGIVDSFRGNKVVEAVKNSFKSFVEMIKNFWSRLTGTSSSEVDTTVTSC